MAIMDSVSRSMLKRVAIQKGTSELSEKLRLLAFVNRNQWPEQEDVTTISWADLNTIADVLTEAANVIDGKVGG